MTAPLRILILEDRPADVELMLHELRRDEFTLEWQRVDTEADYIAALQAASGKDLDIILSDYNLPQFTALQALHFLQERDLDIPFIVVTGSVSEAVAVECMKQGATDYLLKDRMARLGEAVKSALREKGLRDEKRQAEAAMHLREDLSHMIVHDMRSPLTVILMTVRQSVQRVLDNLMSNALKFPPLGSTITLRAEYPEVGTTSQSTGPLVRVQVIDKGPDIAEEHRARIFNKYEIPSLKEDGARQVGPGLAFCKMAVEAHGGCIFVDANEPEGSIFTVEI
jgi:signal transduction histidine kinase